VCFSWLPRQFGSRRRWLGWKVGKPLRPNARSCSLNACAWNSSSASSSATSNPDAQKRMFTVSIWQPLKMSSRAGAKRRSVWIEYRNRPQHGRAKRPAKVARVEQQFSESSIWRQLRNPLQDLSRFYKIATVSSKRNTSIRLGPQTCSGSAAPLEASGEHRSKFEGLPPINIEEALVRAAL
jgi:hypothetical protein